MKPSYRIFFAHGDEASRRVISEMLRVLDHRLELVTDSGRELIQAVRDDRPDLLISGVQLSDIDGIDALIECGREDPVPSIVVSKETDQEKVEHALQDHVMAYLAEPLQANDLRPAIFLVMNRFAQFQELRKENQELKQALEVRKWVERAKGLLMKTRQLDEEAAYKQLQRLATDGRKKIGEVAKTLVEADAMLSD